MTNKSVQTKRSVAQLDLVNLIDLKVAVLALAEIAAPQKRSS